MSFLLAVFSVLLIIIGNNYSLVLPLISQISLMLIQEFPFCFDFHFDLVKDNLVTMGMIIINNLSN